MFSFLLGTFKTSYQTKRCDILQTIIIIFFAFFWYFLSTLCFMKKQFLLLLLHERNNNKKKKILTRSILSVHWKSSSTVRSFRPIQVLSWLRPKKINPHIKCQLHLFFFCLNAFLHHFIPRSPWLTSNNLTKQQVKANYSHSGSEASTRTWACACKCTMYWIFFFNDSL